MEMGMEMEMEMEMVGRTSKKETKRLMKRTKKTAQRKKARFADPVEDWSIYFLVRAADWKDYWYVTDLVNNDATMNDLRARKLDMQYPEVNAFHVSFGSYGTLIYGFGGCSLDEFFRSVFFYDTANPKNGWARGPDMIATRYQLGCTHRVVDGKLYVLGGVALSEEDKSSYPWGEYLDLSSAPSFVKWHPLDFPLSPLSHWSNSSAFEELPIMRGEVDPDCHILVDVGWPGQIVVCYDVPGNLFCRILGSDILGSYDPHTIAVDLDYVFFPNGVDVLALGLFGKHSSQPGFVGSVEGMYRTCYRLPPPPPCSEPPFFIENRAAFSLVRIAPFKYATLWSPDRNRDDKKESAVVRLSVFTVSPASPPLVENGIHFLRAKFNVSDVRLELALQVHVRIIAAVAVPRLTSQQQ